MIMHRVAGALELARGRATTQGLLALRCMRIWVAGHVSIGLLFFMACGALMGGNMLFASYSVDYLLRSEAKHTAERWAHQFVSEFPRFDLIADGRDMNPDEWSRFRSIKLYGEVFLFKLFDRRGDLVIASDKLGQFSIAVEGLRTHNAVAFRAIETKSSYVDIQSGAGKADRPRHYAEAYVPLVKDDKVVATVEVYVDQSDRFALYHQHGRLAALIIGLLSAAVFALPALVAVIRSRQKTLADRRIQHLARHDGLTNVANRAEFNRVLETVLADEHDGAITGLLCLDLDNFKPVNDSLGHDAGDELLRQVAHRLKSHTREHDTVARLGGDEFAVMYGPVNDAADCEGLALRLIHSLREPFTVLGHTVQIGTSIGIALLPKDGRTAAGALKAADIALYKAKADGRGTCRFFERGMDEDLQRRRRLESDLRLAIGAGQFELHYQAQYDLATSRVIGHEALIRWRHPERGMVSPAEFIPLAEDTALIQPIGKWVLAQACLDASMWPVHERVSVNLSAVQLRSSAIVAEVADALRRSGLAPDRLELEITESAILSQTELALAILNELKALGVRISMDDFGTGYSSLSYLQKFPFDKIKIDKTFIDNLGDCKESMAIVRAVIGMGSSLGKTTTAEGVETIQQLELLRREGCSEIQGYFISKPVPATELDKARQSMAA